MNRSILTITLSVVIVLCGLAITARADSIRDDQLEMSGAWIRKPPASAPVAGAYLKITNHGNVDDKLVGATASVSEMVQVHEMRMDGDVMKMREIDSLALPAGGSAELKPGGSHLMLIGLLGSFASSDTVEITLRFENAGDVTVPFEIRDTAPSEENLR